MATAPAVRKSGAFLHDRPTWSAREDRTPSAVWLGILWLGMIAGFGEDFPRFLHENPAAPKVLYVHGAVFSIWMLLFTAQVLLVLRNHVEWHRTLGWVSAAWAGIMAILGPWAAMASYAVNLHTPGNDTAFIAVNFVDLAGFLVLLVWGIALRKNVAAHKRIMILATISLADPGFSRFLNFLPVATTFLPWYLEVFYGNLLLVALMAGWDWWRGRLMRSFVVGAAGLLTAEVLAAVLHFWSPWGALTHTWVEMWAAHFS